MTVGVAWIGRRRDGREHLFIASDSRLSGGARFDAAPKIITLPRSDCAISFAGSTDTTYPLMLQLAHAIAAHEPARERGMDIAQLKEHMLSVFTDLAQAVYDAAAPLRKDDVQFIFAGYSWRAKDFRIWAIYYDEHQKRFRAREARSFHPRLRQAAFIGDRGNDLRARIARKLATNPDERHVYVEPLRDLAEMLANPERGESVGGPPQLVRVAQHMNTRPLCVRWRGVDTLFGRPLFDYENTDYWTIDPASGRLFRPRKFGHRDRAESGHEAIAVDESDDLD